MRRGLHYQYATLFYRGWNRTNLIYSPFTKLNSLIKYTLYILFTANHKWFVVSSIHLTLLIPSAVCLANVVVTFILSGKCHHETDGWVFIILNEADQWHTMC